MPPAQLAELCRETKLPVHTADDLRTAVEIARSSGELVLIAGSLFLVGEARVAYANAPTDPIAVSDPPASTT
jgi:folylpolyglutamate synthase/dihydropteroate synthase